MDYFLNTASAVAGDRSGDIHTLGSAKSHIEVWPFLGFNCLRWQVDGDEVLYRAPDWEQNPIPTRSGHPILFPFPNRLRHGKFSFGGREYQLPLNETSGLHAIHGFTPKNVWRMVDGGTGSDHAWLTGEFCISQDLPQCRECWPADARIRLTYRVFADRLRVETQIDAVDGKAMPFGLGFHPYFAADLSPGVQPKCELHSRARKQWELDGTFPTGRTQSESRFSDFAPIGETVLDSLFGDLASTDPMAELRIPRYTLSVHTDDSFRELLLFTPPHRHAIAIEPYTCTTNAANLESEGVDSGWRVLAAGEVYSTAVEYRLRPTL